MVKEEEGFVLETHGKMAKVKTKRHSDCENCGLCPGEDAIVIEARNELGAKPGQKVSIELKEDNMLKAAFVVYIMPILMVFAGVATGVALCAQFNMKPEILASVLGSLFFAISIIAIKAYEKFASTRLSMRPIIKKILK